LSEPAVVPGVVISAVERLDAQPEVVFDFLSSLENHWQIAGRWIEVVSLKGPPGAPDGASFDRAEVVMRGPLGISRRARTRVLAAERPRLMHGRAELGRSTVASVRWELRPVGDGTEVALSATVEQAGIFDRLMLALGGRAWLRRSFVDVLTQLRQQPALVKASVALAARRAPVSAP
jgi:hypothetical protein